MDLESTEDIRSSFESVLTDAISEVRRHTRIGTTAILKDLRIIGAVQSAKVRLAKSWLTDLGGRFANYDRLSEFSQAALRIGRPDLAIETLALASPANFLFAPVELELASRRSAEFHFQSSRIVEPVVTEPRSQLIRTLGVRSNDSNGDLFLRIELGQNGSLCAITRKLDEKLHAGAQWSPSSMIRGHLDSCAECRRVCDALQGLYCRFDNEVLQVWYDLVCQVEAIQNPDLDRLDVFMEVRPDEWSDRTEYDVMFETVFQEEIGPRLGWRMVKLGCLIGRLMTTLEATYPEAEEIWINWLSRHYAGSAAKFVQAAGAERVRMAMVARNVSLSRKWDALKLPLFLPSIGDLSPVPGLLRVDHSDDLEEWDEVLGPAPNDLGVFALLSICESAASGQLSGRSIPERDSTAKFEHTLSRIDERLNAIHNDQNSERVAAKAIQAASLEVLESIASRLIGQSLFSAEDSLREIFGELWPKLDPHARAFLLASEQIRKIPSLATPSLIVLGIAIAFETELRSRVLPALFAFLDDKNVPKLAPQPGWASGDKSRPVWTKGSKAEECTLGNARLIFAHPEPAIDEFLGRLLGIQRTELQAALEELCPHRNAAAHGRPIDIGMAEQLYSDWLQPERGRGGIFGLLFRRNET